MMTLGDVQGKKIGIRKMFLHCTKKWGINYYNHEMCVYMNILRLGNIQLHKLHERYF